ncbi:MAG: electron-transfer flavoprotein:ubiquinone oxidoreductase [Candidatus Omnitrophota bacterium]
MRPIDMLVVGAGPAGLAAAIRFKQKQPEACVVVLDKALRPGAQSLSGAVMEAACLDELLPGWRLQEDTILGEMIPVTQDEMYFLTPHHAWKVSPLLVPSGMHHAGDQIVSLVKLVAWLGRIAVRLGIEVCSGFSARSLIWDRDVVRGVKLVEQGLLADGQPGAGYLSGEEVFSPVTVLADGARGSLSQEYALRVGGNLNPQVYSLGVKQIFRLTGPNVFGTNRVVHTLGYPHRSDVFGGGFIYSMAHDFVAVGLILGLDWKYQDLNPQQEFEIYKTHPLVASAIKDARLVEAGAKMIPEGGFYALGQVWNNGAVVVGDAAGFVNMQKIKGVHYAVRSGMAAADAAAGGDLSAYLAGLKARGVWHDMHQARNFRACFQWGLLAGAPLSQVQGMIPWRISMGRDDVAMRSGARLARTQNVGVDRAAFAALSGAAHREDEVSHLVISDPGLCTRCAKDFQSPCTLFCPTQVYRRDDSGMPVHISASNCLHCGTCAVKCPLSNIVWMPPEGGEGPRYTVM